MQFARYGGFSFSGNRDLYKVLGYQRTLLPRDYRARYERNAIAARVVEVLPKATWRGGAEVIEDEDESTETEFEKAFQDLINRVNLWPALLRGDILSQLGQYAVILIGAPGELNDPLKKGRPEDLLYMQPFAEDDAQVMEWELDAQNPRFGQPKFYTLRRTNVTAAGNQATAQLGKPVHFTRILHLADNALDDQIFGTPRLQRCWNLFDDLEKVTGGGSEAFWLRANQGLQLDVDKEMELSPEDEKALKDETDEYANQIRRVMRTRGVTAKVLGSDVANFSSQCDAILQQIAGGLGIPARILLGSERGELASSQDRSNWHDQIKDRRATYAGPMILRVFVDRCIEYGWLPTPSEYEIRWSELKDLDDAARADLALKAAQTNAAYQGEVVITPDEIRSRYFDLDPLGVRQEAIVQPAPAIAEAPVPPGLKKAPKPEPVVALPTGNDPEDVGPDELDTEGNPRPNPGQVGKKRAAGGAGSGNFGHGGRPGEVGGSSSEGANEYGNTEKDIHDVLSTITGGYPKDADWNLRHYVESHAQDLKGKSQSEMLKIYKAFRKEQDTDHVSDTD